jgi:hypothetical protein
MKRLSDGIRTRDRRDHNPAISLIWVLIRLARAV